MRTDCIIEDHELGQLRVRVDGRARRLTFRTRPEAIYVTVPPHTTRTELTRAIEQLRPRLREARQRSDSPVIDLNFRIDADFFRLSLESGTQPCFLSHTEGNHTRIVCPPHTDFADTRLQAWLRKVVEEALRREGKRFLPVRLRQLSLQHGLPFRQVKVNASTGRWGSCSARGDINLSCFLMLLPARLVDYVLLHELAHTREMNHGEGFWALLDRLTEGRAHALRDELTAFRSGL